MSERRITMIDYKEICPEWEQKGIVLKADGTFAKKGRCRRANLDCECKGGKSSCDYYPEIRKGQKQKYDAAPYMHDVNIIIKYREDGSYTIGWKKEMYGEQYGDYITCKADEPIEKTLPSVCEEFIDMIARTVTKIKEQKGDT
jgi:hypothetical protein